MGGLQEQAGSASITEASEAGHRTMCLPSPGNNRCWGVQGVGMEGLHRSRESIHKRGAFQVPGTKCNTTTTCKLSQNCAVPTMFLPVTPQSWGRGTRREEGEGCPRTSGSARSRQWRAQPYPCHSSAQCRDPGESCTNTGNVAQD